MRRQNERNKIAVRLSRNLLRLRKAKSFTQKELSERTGITDISISRYENGERIPDAVNLYLLAKALGVKVEDLYR